MKINNVFYRICFFLFLILSIVSCGADESKNENIDGFDTISISHKLGNVSIDQRPVRVAALDMNEVDLLDQLDISVAGMPKDFIPNYLSSYADDPNIADLGAIVQPNIEKIYALKPDLILMSPLQANYYSELSELAPTLLLDVDYKDSGSEHFNAVINHLLTLGKIFDKEELAKRKADLLNTKVEQARDIIKNRPEKAMIVLRNNGAYSFLGEKSRYGFVFQALGVKPVSSPMNSGLHGQPISSEFIFENNPDIIYVVDRTSVMERTAALNRDTMDNPLIRQTNAWQNNRVIFVDSQAWYITGAGYSALQIVIDDVLKGYASE